MIKIKIALKIQEFRLSFVLHFETSDFTVSVVLDGTMTLHFYMLKAKACCARFLY